MVSSKPHPTSKPSDCNSSRLPAICTPESVNLLVDQVDIDSIAVNTTADILPSIMNQKILERNLVQLCKAPFGSLLWETRTKNYEDVHA